MTYTHHLWGADFLYGLIGCVVIVLLSKALGKLFIQRREDFYDEGKKNR